MIDLSPSLKLLSSLLGVSSIKHFTPLKSISAEWHGEGPIWFHLALWGCGAILHSHNSNSKWYVFPFPQNYEKKISLVNLVFQPTDLRSPTPHSLCITLDPETPDSQKDSREGHDWATEQQEFTSYWIFIGF